MNRPKIAVILGSTRPGRNGRAVADWVMERAASRTGADYELIDLADYPLPHLDEPIPPSQGRYTGEHTKGWAATIASYDGYVADRPRPPAGVLLAVHRLRGLPRVRPRRAPRGVRGDPVPRGGVLVARPGRGPRLTFPPHRTRKGDPPMSTLILPRIEVRRAADRPASRLSWLESRHSFAVGRPDDDPRNTHHGLLLVHNEDLVQPGAGFETHPHRDMEIVTWVLDGSLVHQDSTGPNGVVYPGLAQRMSAGTGILHSEKNDARLPAGPRPGDPVHFVQMWVVPDESGITPGYEQLEIGGELLSGGLVAVACGMDRHRDVAAIRIKNRHAALHAARLRPGRHVQLPDAPYLHLFVTRGAVDLEGVGALGPGDAARLTAAGGRRVAAAQPAEILAWEMHADLAG
jgi:quercetin 2,3-dioxygenase